MHILSYLIVNFVRTIFIGETCIAVMNPNKHKSKNMRTTTTLIIGQLTLLAGILLIVYSSHITSDVIVSIGGVTFIIAGLLNMLVAYKAKDASGQRRVRGLSMGLTAGVSLIAVVFGICVLVYRDTFLPLVSVVAGTGVGLCAVVQFYILAVTRHPSRLPLWLYLFPVANAVLAGIVYTLSTPAQDRLMMIYAGVALCVYSICHDIALVLRLRMLQDAEKLGGAPEADNKPTEIKGLDEDR